MFRFAFLAVGCVFAQVALCQSFNVDLDVPFASPPEGGGGPSSTFGAAANQPGYWNAIYAVGPHLPIQLSTLSGSLTSVTMVASGGIGTGGGVNFSGNTGDFALLLNDFASVGFGSSNTYTLNGLAESDYVVYTYAVAPSHTGHTFSVSVTGSLDGVRTVTGPMPGNMFLEGVTHSVHHVHANGTLSITIATGSNLVVDGVNGFQIVAVPEPSTLLIGLSAIGVFISKRRRR